MKAIAIERFGEAGGLAVVEKATPDPAPSQVLIETEAIGVGGVDAVIRRGTLGSAFPLGMVPGSEVAGVVTAVGADGDPSWLGRRVWAFTGTSGGYAEQAVAEVQDVTALPGGLTSTDAVALGSAATVARLALDHAHLAPGESVLVRGAAGSIGIAAVELAARSGAAAVAVTASSEPRGSRLLSLGATHVLDRDGAGAPGAPGSFDVVIDIVGGPAVPLFLDRLAPNGRLVLVGAVAGYPPADFGQTLLRSFQESRSFATFSLASVPIARRNAVRAALFDDAVQGTLTPVVHEILPLDRAADAHRAMDDGSVFGRIVLVP
ncbi:zinc-binding dehydrogenase [Frondihabitans australicus]|uniref:NADPH:quinone reductase-like Zn-dependent oxidoreductase n=1 Tax=Frondihabitans australicus TaxID=386892 RepID=A0A495IIZ3_9MICO|nr:zinc-binding dehydrogenase [Frondihabitans australicus]RKR75947.1 NADPH:quinone reductase-like Zn-dependent oxidoreductase [Frondihabitans australicus]